MNEVTHPSNLLKPEWVTTIRKNAMAAEQEGQLQAAQLELIYQQKWFKLLVPQVYGGLEMPLPALVRLEEALSWADGSLGWVITLCAGAGWFGGFIAPDLANHIFADPQVCLAGSGASTGTAERVGNSYVINGAWKYASGVKHATHFTANCMITENGETITNPDGTPLIVPFVIDKKDAILIPAWKYVGMIGTGSHAFAIGDLMINAGRSFKIDAAAAIIDAPLYKYPFLQLAEATLAANLSGLAVHFVDLCDEIFKNKPRLTPAKTDVLARELESARWNMQQCRSSFYEAVDTSWQLFTGQANAGKALEAVSKTSRQLAKIARETVDALYPYCGLMAASPDTEINQVWRDLHTASQHALLTFLE